MHFQNDAADAGGNPVSQTGCAGLFINGFLHKVAPKTHKCFVPDYYKWRR